MVACLSIRAPISIPDGPVKRYKPARIVLVLLVASVRVVVMHVFVFLCRYDPCQYLDNEKV